MEISSTGCLGFLVLLRQSLQPTNDVSQHATCNSKCSKLPLTFQEHHLIYLIARHRSNIRKGVVSGQNLAKRTSVTQMWSSRWPRGRCDRHKYQFQITSVIMLRSVYEPWSECSYWFNTCRAPFAVELEAHEVTACNVLIISDVYDPDNRTQSWFMKIRAWN